MSRFGGGLNFYVYAENDPVNMIDPTGHRAYEAYGTMSEALLEAQKDARSISKITGNEAGGYLYENGDGTFAYTPPSIMDANGKWNTPTDSTLGERPDGAVASYHTHGCTPGSQQESSQDQTTAHKSVSNKGGLPGVIFMPDGSWLTFGASGLPIPELGFYPVWTSRTHADPSCPGCYLRLGM